MTVSVIIPCYNSGATLNKAIDSVLAQTYKDIELIVVNDGSTDPETIHVINSLDISIQVVNQKNSGLPAARNAGITVATGDYIFPLDSDDFIDVDFIDKCVLLMNSDNNEHYVYSAMKTFGDITKVLHRDFNLFEQLFLNRLPYALFYTKEMWCKVGGYDEGMIKGLEDWEFNLNMAKHGFYGKELDSPMFNYNVSQSGMLNNITHNYRAQIWTYIQHKHKSLYTMSGLINIWKVWRHKKMKYPVAIHVFIYGAHRLLPNFMFNRFYTWILQR